MPRALTAEMRARIEALLLEGRYIADVARLAGVGSTTVSNHIKTNAAALAAAGWVHPGRRPPDFVRCAKARRRAIGADGQARETLASMWLAGAPIPDIQQALGCSYEDVQHWRRALGLPGRPKGWNPDRGSARPVSLRRTAGRCPRCEIRLEYVAGCPRPECPDFDRREIEAAPRTLAGVASYG